MDARLAAYWFERQGLDGSLAGAAPEEVLERSGWARSVAGVNPYLTLFARAGTSREATDEAVAARRIHELPAARGCTYVVPASEYAIALAVGRRAPDGDVKAAAKLGVTEEELARLARAVTKALAKGPLDPAKIREKVGDAARSLGEAGKKRGLTTTLPLALGRLQASGDIRRVPENGRLDQQRYRYALWEPNPMRAFEGTDDDALRELASRYFRWVGPATPGEFQWFSGLGVKAARAVLAELDLAPSEPGSERLLHADDLAGWRKFRAPAKPRYALVSSLDTLFAARRDVRSLVDDADAVREVHGEKAALALGAISDLPSHAIVDRGRLIGLWEYDPERAELVHALFDGRPDKALAKCIAETEAFLRDEVGDARSFSLDSPASRRPRLAALRAAAR